MPSPVLEARGICKSYGGVRVLDGVHIRLFPGEVHALVGENGAGKSTLIKALTGIVRPEEGGVYLRGEPLRITHPKEIAAHGIGLVHQEFNLMPDLSVAQNIFIGREPRGLLRGLVSERKLREQAGEVLARIGCGVAPGARVAGLSVAQQQMVEIAKALSHNCDILIMDEPTAALTDTEADALFAVVDRLRAEGAAILFVSHRMSDLQRLADRVSVLRDGRFIAEHRFAETDLDTLVREMVGREMADVYPARPDYKRGEKTLQVEHLQVPGVLHDICFDAYQGEILGIAGLMGSGRTELAKALIGALPPTGGSIRLRGERLTRLTPSRAVRMGIGYVTEDRKKDGLFLDMDIRENTIAASYPHYSPRALIRGKRAREDAERLMKRLRIRAAGPGQRVLRLSGGNQQKVVLAKWLCRGSSVLILDEPTRGIDVGSKYEIYEMMHSLVQRGVTILMISSELPEILGMSDRVLVMCEGRITADLPRCDATQETIARHSLGK